MYTYFLLYRGMYVEDFFDSGRSFHSISLKLGRMIGAIKNSTGIAFERNRFNEGVTEGDVFSKVSGK